MPLWLQIIIVASTFAALLFAAYGIWFGSKQKQAQFDRAANELEHTVAAQQKLLETAVRRIQNLEAIVTSPLWDTVHEDAVPETEEQRARLRDAFRLDAMEEGPSDAEHIARIARRLET